jgi:hypothetical protein
MAERVVVIFADEHAAVIVEKGCDASVMRGADLDYLRGDLLGLCHCGSKSFYLVSDKSAVVRQFAEILRGLLAFGSVSRFLFGLLALLCGDLLRIIFLFISLVLLLAGERLVFVGRFLFHYIRVNVIRLAVELIDERAFLFCLVLGELRVDVVSGRFQLKLLDVTPAWRGALRKI